MHEEKWQEILDDFLVHEVIKESINDANHKGPEKPLIGMERKADQVEKASAFHLFFSLTEVIKPKKKNSS